MPKRRLPSKFSFLLAAADYDGDGAITVLDALTVMRKAMGMI